MPLPRLERLGDEPIYCQATHDDAAWSGSEDDYYEAPEHRRLRIEAKALQFLSGNVPFLMSARLNGPFDKLSWNNPWTSRRATRQSIPAGTKTGRSIETPQKARGNCSGQAPQEDLPDTQGTSLYPLPSPEITNPPSARKNPYMDEDEYNRVKSWRKKVKGTLVSTDPFWLSQQDGSDDSSVVKKRSADREWLHERGAKKRKSADLRTSPPAESSSRAALNTRKGRIRRVSHIVTQSAPGSSTHDDELATAAATRVTSFDASRLANVTTGTPDIRRPGWNTQFSERQSLFQESESSEDELSKPSTTPPAKDRRSYSTKLATSVDNHSPSRRMRASKGISRCSSGRERARAGQTVFEEPGSYQPSLSQRSGLDEIQRLAKQAEKAVLATTENVLGSAGQETVDEPEPGPNQPPPVQTEPVVTENIQEDQAETGPDVVESTRLADVLLSQQDDSFFFHKRTNSPPEMLEPQRSAKHARNGMTLSLSSLQLHIAAAAAGRLDKDCDAPNVEETEDQSFIPPDSGDQMEVNCTEAQGAPDEPVNEPVAVDESRAADAPQVLDEPELMDEPQGLRELKGVKETTAADVTQPVVEPEPKIGSLNMHESEAVSELQASHEHQAATGPQAVIHEIYPHSDTEWSTYINTQDLTTASDEAEAPAENAQNVQLVEQGAYDPSDPEWSTYINTQDLSIADAKTEVVHRKVDGVQVVEQGPNDHSDPDWSTVLNTQDQSTSPNEQGDKHSDSNCAEAMDLEITTPKHCTPIVAADDESKSEWSTDMSASSQVYAYQTGNTSHELVATETPPGGKSPQGSVQFMIDAYTEADQTLEYIHPSKESNEPDESLQGNVMSMAQPARDEAVDPELGQKKDGDITVKELHDIAFSIADLKREEADEPDLEHNIEKNEPGEIAEDRTVSIAHLESDEAVEPEAAEAEDDCVINYLADSRALDETAASIEPRQPQSPWANEGVFQLRPSIALENDTTLNGSTPNLRAATGKALSMSTPAQSPWTSDRLPTPDFTMSVKRFSDFTTPSPIKKRVSLNGSILRSSSAWSGVLFKTPDIQKLKRRVTFAPLPGEEAGDVEAASKDEEDPCVEVDTSYFDPSGHKKDTIRVRQPKARGASPPPVNANSAGAGDLPDHDHKFCKHFEAMAKRKKNPPRRTPRLLPSDSQPTSGSQGNHGVGAMAEAFIQASQTRRKGLALTEMAAGGNSTRTTDDSLLPEKSCSPVIMDALEGQENIEPVDDVSAVLDNLGDFLDKTWGVDISLDTGAAAVDGTQAQHQQQAKTNSSQEVRRALDSIGDPRLGLEVNVWAD